MNTVTSQTTTQKKRSLSPSTMAATTSSNRTKQGRLTAAQAAALADPYLPTSIRPADTIMREAADETTSPAGNLFELQRLLYAMETGNQQNGGTNNSSWEAEYMRADLLQALWQNKVSPELQAAGDVDQWKSLQKRVQTACQQAWQHKPPEQSDLASRTADVAIRKVFLAPQQQHQQVASTTSTAAAQIRDDHDEVESVEDHAAARSLSDNGHPRSNNHASKDLLPAVPNVEDMQKAQREQIEEAIQIMAAQMKEETSRIHSTLRVQTVHLSKLEDVAADNVEQVTAVTQDVHQHVARSWKKTVGTWTLLLTMAGVFVFTLMTIQMIPKRPGTCLFFCDRQRKNNEFCRILPSGRKECIDVAAQKQREQQRESRDLKTADEESECELGMDGECLHDVNEAASTRTKEKKVDAGNGKKEEGGTTARVEIKPETMVGAKENGNSQGMKPEEKVESLIRPTSRDGQQSTGFFSEPFVAKKESAVVDERETIPFYNGKPFAASDVRKVAAAGELEALIEMLTIKPMWVNARDSNGWTALHMAARSGHGAMVRYLIQQPDCDIDLKTVAGRTAREIAEAKGHSNIVDILDGVNDLDDTGLVEEVEETNNNGEDDLMEPTKGDEATSIEKETDEIKSSQASEETNSVEKDAEVIEPSQEIEGSVSVENDAEVVKPSPESEGTRLVEKDVEAIKPSPESEGTRLVEKDVEAIKPSPESEGTRLVEKDAEAIKPSPESEGTRLVEKVAEAIKPSQENEETSPVEKDAEVIKPPLESEETIAVEKEAAVIKPPQESEEINSVEKEADLIEPSQERKETKPSEEGEEIIAAEDEADLIKPSEEGEETIAVEDEADLIKPSEEREETIAVGNEADLRKPSQETSSFEEGADLSKPSRETSSVEDEADLSKPHLVEEKADLMKASQEGEAANSVAEIGSSKPIALKEFLPEDLRTAAGMGYLQDVEAIIAAKPEFIDSQDANGWAALHLAARLGNEQIIQLLLKSGADRHLETLPGLTALDIAAEHHGRDHPSTVSLRQGEDLLVTLSNGKEALPHDFRIAAHAGDLELLTEILQLKPEWINLQDRNGWAAVHEAARSGHLEVLRLVLQSGGNPNLLNSIGESPLMIAREVLGDDHAVTKLLLEVASP